ncbi:hypothetical protein [Streptomyces sp. NPDC088258]|uniref:hypothetical protein n=1 Tax=Streptomyces sp. NPDC088258 TaxID=3365849 RepID=UPI00381109C9
MARWAVRWRLWRQRRDQLAYLVDVVIAAEQTRNRVVLTELQLLDNKAFFDRVFGQLPPEGNNDG